MKLGEEKLDFYYIVCTKLHLTELKRFLKYRNSKIIDIKCHDLREENNSISKKKKAKPMEEITKE